MLLADPIVRLPSPRVTKYGRLRAMPFTGDPTLPGSSEVVIIGGGIMGATTAFYLAKAGTPVLLLEKAEIACEASSRAFGWVSELMLDAANQPMAQEAKRLWPELHAEVGETGFRQNGLVLFAENDAEAAQFEAWLNICRNLISSGTRMMSTDELVDRFPGASRRFAAGLFAPSDGGAEPTLATAAIAEAARRAGARIVTDCAVRGLDRKAGRIAGVFTEKGYVRSSTVVAAMNSWSRLFCGNHGIDIPQIYVFMSMGCTSRADGPVGAGGTMAWAWRRQIDGGYSLGGVMGIRAPVTRDAITLRRAFKPLITSMGGGDSSGMDLGWDAWNDLRLARRWNPHKRSPFEKLRVLAGNVRPIAEKSLELNARVFPTMATGGVCDSWAGPLTLTPDNKAILGPVAAIPGFHIITGCSYGISWAPAIGKWMADSVTGLHSAFDARPFRLSRFTDGSKLEMTH